MNRIWKKYQKFWTLAIFLCLMGGAYYFGLRWIVAAIESKNQRIEEVSALREYRQNRMKDLAKYRAQQDVIDRDESRLKSLLDKSDKEAVKAFIESVESLAENTGSRYETISLAEKNEIVKPGVVRKTSAAAKALAGIWSDLPEVPYMRLEMSVSGPFSSVFTFLRKLENMPYFVDVVGFKMIPAEKDKQDSSPFSAGALISQGVAKQPDKSPDGEDVQMTASVVIYTQEKTNE